jgi:hypothetical protein
MLFRPTGSAVRMAPKSVIVGSRSILPIQSFKSGEEMCGYTKRLRSFMRHTCLARRLAAAVGRECLCAMALMDQPDIRSLLGQVPAGSRAPMPRTFPQIPDDPEGASASAAASRCAERCRGRGVGDEQGMMSASRHSRRAQLGQDRGDTDRGASATAEAIEAGLGNMP